MSNLHGRGWSILVGDALDRLRGLPSDHFHAVVTSPPYWGLRDYGVEGQIGLERSVNDFLAKMVDIFSEVRRVLRPDGSLWLNIGDTYSTDMKWGGKSSNKHEMEVEFPRKKERSISGMKPKEMVGVPWKLAFALSADGWYLRQEIIWSKRSPMPESVRDRATKSHEHVFLLTKSSKYFYDFMRARQKASGIAPGNKTDGKYGLKKGTEEHRTKAGLKKCGAHETANFRSVWTLSSEPYRGAHFATFPTELVRRCLLAAVSERGCCPTCGSPAERIVERQRVQTRPGTNSKVMKHPSGWSQEEGSHSTIDGRYDYREKGKYHDSITGNRDPRRHVTRYATIGFKQNCECEPMASVPCRVLDPFAGAGTTLMVARRMNCEAIGIDLNPEYAAMAAKRIVDDQPLFNVRAS